MRLPVHIRDRAAKIRKLSATYAEEHDHEARLQDYSRRMHISMSRMKPSLMISGVYVKINLVKISYSNTRLV